MSWTIPADVTGAWIGDSAPTDTALIQVWIDKAEREIRRQVPDIQSRIDLEAAAVPPVTALLADAVDVAVNMVIRVFRNPDGVRQRQSMTGPFSESFTIAGSNPGVLMMTDDELAKLQGKRPQAGAFTIDLTPVGAPSTVIW